MTIKDKRRWCCFDVFIANVEADWCPSKHNFQKIFFLFSSILLVFVIYSEQTVRLCSAKMYCDLNGWENKFINWWKEKVKCLFKHPPSFRFFHTRNFSQANGSRFRWLFPLFYRVKSSRSSKKKIFKSPADRTKSFLCFWSQFKNLVKLFNSLIIQFTFGIANEIFILLKSQWIKHRTIIVFFRVGEDTTNFFLCRLGNPSRNNRDDQKDYNRGKSWETADRFFFCYKPFQLAFYRTRVARLNFNRLCRIIIRKSFVPQQQLFPLTMRAAHNNRPGLLPSMQNK